MTFKGSVSTSRSKYFSISSHSLLKRLARPMCGRIPSSRGQIEVIDSVVGANSSKYGNHDISESKSVEWFLLDATSTRHFQISRALGHRRSFWSAWLLKVFQSIQIALPRVSVGALLKNNTIRLF